MYIATMVQVVYTMAKTMVQVGVPTRTYNYTIAYYIYNTKYKYVRYTMCQGIPYIDPSIRMHACQVDAVPFECFPHILYAPSREPERVTRGQTVSYHLCNDAPTPKQEVRGYALALV